MVVRIWLMELVKQCQAVVANVHTVVATRQRTKSDKEQLTASNGQKDSGKHSNYETHVVGIVTMIAICNASRWV